jgi:ABC-type multidrug transport system ATPase subunit
MTAEPLLTLTGVSKRFGRRGPLVVAEAELTLAIGERVHVIGPNGSGKTTLLRLAAGAARPTAGVVTTASWRTWAPVAPVGTDALTPRRLIAALAEPFVAVSLRGEEVLDRLGASAFLDRRIGELSSGTRRKVTLALALSHRPGGTIVLDEPWSTLDVAAAEVVCDLLEEHVAGGSAVLFSDHGDAPERFRAHRTIALAGGRLASEHTTATGINLVTAHRGDIRQVTTVAPGRETDALLRHLLAEHWSIERVEPG